jgi:hypothetical protein
MNLLAAEFFDVRRDNRGNPQARKMSIIEDGGKNGERTSCTEGQNQNQGKDMRRSVVVASFSGSAHRLGGIFISPC